MKYLLRNWVVVNEVGPDFWNWTKMLSHKLLKMAQGRARGFITLPILYCVMWGEPLQLRKTVNNLGELMLMLESSSAQTALLRLRGQ